MRALRGSLRYLACGWLACQLAAVAAPLAPCCTRVSAAEHNEASCCPGVGPGQVCPMHHTREGDRTCKMRDACGHADATLLALTTGAGILTPSFTIASVPHASESISTLAPLTLTRADRPDAPPPRV